MSKPLLTISPHNFTEPPKPVKGSIIPATAGRFHALVNSGNQNIADIFPKQLSGGDQYHWVSLGGWSMYHLIAYVLETTGPAHLSFSTWAISEQSARSLVLWKENGQLLSINGILDVRARTRHEAAFHLISGHCNRLVLAHCHAKVTVLYNQSWHVTILGSANFTENPRIEAGIITSEPQIGQFHLQWINHALNDHL
jgi:hypothetical protein